MAKAQPRSFTPKNSKGETEKRLALVIGNANYQGNILTNPLNDAKAMRTALQELGFTVQYYENLSKSAMEAVLIRFSSDLHKHNVGFFYFAGHGFESKDKVNYLMSTDMNSSVNEALAKDKSLNLDVVMQSMQDANVNSNLLIIDACRNNPFRSWSRDGAKGLGSITPTLGTVVFFAASAGQTADDNREGKNGLFTEEFLTQIRKPNLELSDILKNTSRAVYKRSGGQMPSISGNLLEDFYFSKTEYLSELEALNMGYYYFNKEEYVEAKKMFEIAIEMNNTDAMCFLANMLKGGYKGITIDKGLAKMMIEKAAIQNNGFAMYQLGMMYYDGDIVEKDEVKAIKYFKQSINILEVSTQNNNPLALTVLGAMYCEQAEIEDLINVKDIEKGIKLLEKAANQNFVLAMNFLGEIYSEEGESYNIVKSKYWFEKACSLGSKEACKSSKGRE